MDEIPEREQLMWHDDALRASLTRGLAESAAGDTVESDPRAQCRHVARGGRDRAPGDPVVL